MENSTGFEIYYKKGIDNARITLNKDNVKGDIPDICCFLCNLVPVHPEICDICNKIICSTCLKEYLKTSKSKCPSCFNKYEQGDIPYNLQKIFDNIVISCQYFKNDCLETLSHKNLLPHEKKCPHVNKECDNCKKKLKFEEFEKHSQSCISEKKPEPKSEPKLVEIRKDPIPDIFAEKIKCKDCPYEDTLINWENTEKLVQHVQHRLLEIQQRKLDEMRNELKIYLDQIKIDKTIVENKSRSPSTMIMPVIESSNPETEKIKHLQFKKDICVNVDNNYQVDDRFCVFSSFMDENLVVWGTDSYSLEVYDLAMEKIIREIKKAHTSNIIVCRHTSDTIKKKTYIITSSYDRSIKIWDVENKFENILTIVDAHKDYAIFSCLILANIIDNTNYIFSSNFKDKTNGIKIWDFKGELITIINEKGVRHLSTFFNEKNEKSYLIVCNETEVNSYDLTTNELYKTYNSSPTSAHFCALVNKNGRLIEGDNLGIIRIWDFHTAELVKSITRSSSNFTISSINLYHNSPFLFAASSDGTVLFYDLKLGKNVKGYVGHKGSVYCVKTFDHYLYGPCFFSYGYDGKIKLFINK